MKRLLLLVAILAVLLLPMGCIEGIINSRFDALNEDVTGNFTVKVGGTVGLNFTGEYEGWLYHWQPDTQSLVYTKESHIVEGQVPVEYTFKGATAQVIFQKRTSDYSLLTVEVWKDGVLLESLETTDPWGSVWVGTSPLPEA